MDDSKASCYQDGYDDQMLVMNDTMDAESEYLYMDNDNDDTMNVTVLMDSDKDSSRRPSVDSIVQSAGSFISGLGPDNNNNDADLPSKK